MKSRKIYNTSEQKFRAYYNKYITEYGRKQAALSKRGLRIGEKAYTYNEFKAEYTALRHDLASKGKKGVHMEQALVRSQVYAWSTKQAKAFREGLIRQGIDAKDLPSVEEFRIMGRRALDSYIERIKKQHPEWSMTEIGEEISETIFGSE